MLIPGKEVEVENVKKAEMGLTNSKTCDRERIYAQMSGTRVLLYFNSFHGFHFLLRAYFQ